MDYKEIQDLIKLVRKNEITELEIERDDFKIMIRSQNDKQGAANAAAPQPVVQQAPVAAVPQAQQPTPSPQTAANNSNEEQNVEQEQNSNYIEIKSPMIGTFYRSPGPEKDPFVGIGDKIEKGQTICMVEAMKLFNEIEAEITGKVVKILVEDATPVEFDQTLFLVDPKG